MTALRSAPGSAEASMAQIRGTWHAGTEADIDRHRSGRGNEGCGRWTHR
jgi:hypothetical protein